MANDYGYQTANVQQAASGNVSDTLVETRANRAKSYSNVCSMFLKYNTSLPLSAPVERLFSVGGLILTPRRNKLSDAAFQQLLMLKTNSSVVNM